MKQKNQINNAKYNAGDTIQVIDKNNPYHNRQGTVTRLGAAGEVIYYHVTLQNVSTVMTYTENQLNRV